MSRGFYTLGSGMMTNNRALSISSNNIANVNSIGYKKSALESSTFGEMMVYRIENGAVTELGTVSSLRAATQSVTVFTQGSFDSTGRNLDFAITDEGFFQIQSDQGYVYTRNGNFSIDEEGYLQLAGAGRVMGENGPVYLGTDNVTSDSQGRLYIEGTFQDQIAVYDFQDYENLLVAGEGFFEANTEQPTLIQASIMSQTLETSNVDIAKEMTDAIAAQRNLQACAQALKTYDENLAKAVNEIGRI